MPTNFKQFESQVNKFVKTLAPEQAVKFHRLIALEALRRVVFKTPVDTGRARGAWQTTIGKASSKEGKDSNPVATGAGVLSSLKFLQVVYLSNNVPYFDVLVKGKFRPKNPGPSSDPRKGRKGRVLVKEGFSVQAPKGIIPVTIAELSVIFR